MSTGRPNNSCNASVRPEEAIGDAGPVIQKLNDEVDIACFGVEVVSRGRTEEFQPRNAELLAE